ncbi:hypothetical protein EXIGLDRAFT_599226 [Exidia glandulosa HHB12029]|uniref:Fe2OG dioxygenase domain-containing protein n=1 Tax=Exidia glandulosa HHB12029 TaxID=1314781 RepID=A0A165R3T8_EXIGL|nr:hypothetical protein EXIGLDRAFT_599226 [Exidia glandulosa HHB12029]
MSVSDAQRALILDALVDPKPFYGQGVHTFPAHQLILHAGKVPLYAAPVSSATLCSLRAALSSRIDLGKGAASVDELERLANACQAATFGRNQLDVLDESYRKAGKLDNTDFALNLDITGSGLLDKVHDSLFGWEAQSRDIVAELYKLNVYQTGSFFKAHKDTPRGTTMFGSLVLTFPTPHEGGQLVLRHDGHEHVHDTSAADGVSWVAFFSDVEHEVLPVSSGHRVTLTYNLYIGTRNSPRIRPIVSDALSEAFRTLVADATFMPDGGRLGFGLRHQYPIPTEREEYTYLDQTANLLKGGDSALFNAIESAGLSPALRLRYINELWSHEEYLVDSVWEGADEECELGDIFYREDQIGPGYDDDPEDPRFKNFVWVVASNQKTRAQAHFITYGNEASIRYLYGDLVLVATVPSAAERLST